MPTRRLQPQPNRLCLPLTLVLGLLLIAPVSAAELRVAVASNFLASLRVLAAQFEAQAGIEVVAIAGSTGKLYAQIHQGAPFDLFLAADAVPHGGAKWTY